jgi:hypothetical protein
MDIDQTDITVSDYSSPNHTPPVISTSIEGTTRNLSCDFDPTSHAMSYPSYLLNHTASQIPMQVNAPIEGTTRNLSCDFDPTSHAMSYPSYPLDHTASQIPMQVNEGATRNLSYDFDPTSHAMSYPSYPFGHTASQTPMQDSFGNNAIRGLLCFVDPATAQTSIACGERRDSMFLDETI